MREVAGCLGGIPKGEAIEQIDGLVNCLDYLYSLFVQLSGTCVLRGSLAVNAAQTTNICTVEA